MDQNIKVIVVGAGPVGLVSALLLQQRGIPFVLLESNADLPDDLRASTFHPPTLDMLDCVGVAKALIAQGLISPAWQVRIHPSGERAEFDLGLISDFTYHPYRLQCEQSRLCRLLLETVRSNSGGSILLGRTVRTVSQDQRKVTVVAEAEDGSRERFEAAYLIAADGARSIVRRSLGFTFEGKTYPETTILATTRFPFEEHLPNLSNVNYVWKEGGTFSLLRLRDLWRCSLYPDADESVEEALGPESISRKLNQIVPGAGDHSTGEVRAYRIHMRLAGDYRDNRVLLAGDAAHVNSPSGGMGMNGGIHDAFELVDAISDVLDGAAVDRLDLYTRRRRPVAEAEILTQADRNRARMQERDWDKRRQMLADLQKLAADPVAAREHLLKTSMISGLKRAAQVE